MASSDQAQRAIRRDLLRRQAQARRRAQTDRAALSRQVGLKARSRPEFLAARTVLLYLAARAELTLDDWIPVCWSAGQRVAVPYCLDGRLELFWLRDFDELSSGAYQIREPRPEWRCMPDRRVSPREVDLVVAPCVAFDASGTRLGYGAGYYDKLLALVPDHVPLWAVAFECQRVDEIPRESHDVPLNLIITEVAEYPGSPRPPRESTTREASRRPAPNSSRMA